jgi:hypothetical protein
MRIVPFNNASWISDSHLRSLFRNGKTVTISQQFFCGDSFRAWPNEFSLYTERSQLENLGWNWLGQTAVVSCHSSFLNENESFNDWTTHRVLFDRAGRPLCSIIEPPVLPIGQNEKGMVRKGGEAITICELLTSDNVLPTWQSFCFSSPWKHTFSPPSPP